MHSIGILVCVILVFFLGASSHLVDDENDDEIANTWYAFQKILSNPSSFVGSESIQLASLLDDPRFFRIPIHGKPILHQILNIYWMTRDNKVKQSIVDLLLMCIRKGADPDEIAVGEPDALTKSILIRELRVSAALTMNSESAVYADGKKYWELFSLPCNPTPLTKLLLHANTIAYRRYVKSHGNQQTFVKQDMVSSELEKGLRKLLSSAFLDGQSPVVKIQDLDVMSSSYDSMIVRISNTTANHVLTGHNSLDASREAEPLPQSDIHSEVSLAEVTESVGDAVSIVQDAMLLHRKSSPLAVATALSVVISKGRNSLHMLATAGSVSLIKKLLSYFQSHLQSDKMSESKTVLRSAFDQIDYRGLTALSYSWYRYGAHSTQYRTLRILAELVDANEFMPDGVNLISKVDTKVAIVAIDGSNTALSRNITTMNNNNIDDNTDTTNLDQQSMSQAQALHSGGWDPSSLPSNLIGDTSMCDIEENWDGIPTATEFFMKYVRLGKPVIFRGAALGSRIRDAFQKESFLTRYGSQRTSASAIPYANSFGFSTEALSLTEAANSKSMYIRSNNHEDGSINGTTVDNSQYMEMNEAPQYVFTVSSNQFKSMLDKDAPAPSFLQFKSGSAFAELDLSEGSVAVQFYLGPAGSGAPVHFHGHAVNTLAYGEKKWFLFAPANAFYSTAPAFDFVTKDPRANIHSTQTKSTTSTNADPKPQPLAMHCTQHAGDMIYVPTLWGHATINVKQSIGVAHEFSIESFCME